MDDGKGTKTLEELRESVNTLTADLAATERQMSALGLPAKIAKARHNAEAARHDARTSFELMPTFEGTPQERLDKERAWAHRAATARRTWLDQAKAHRELVLSYEHTTAMVKDLEGRLAYMRTVLTWAERILATRAELEGA
jgi:hypothetical protein